MLLVLIVFAGLFVVAFRKNKAFAIKSLLAALVLGLISIVAFEMINGPHAECGTNDSIGPCNLSGRIVYDLPLLPFPAMIFWLIIFSVEWLGELIRGRRK